MYQIQKQKGLFKPSNQGNRTNELMNEWRDRQTTNKQANKLPQRWQKNFKIIVRNVLWTITAL